MTLRPDEVPPGGERPGGPPRPRLRPTNPATLVVAALVTAALAWLGISRWYGDLPNLNWLPGLTLAGLAVTEGIMARTTKARIDQRPRAGRINPLLVARYAVLARHRPWPGRSSRGPTAVCSPGRSPSGPGWPPRSRTSYPLRRA